MPDPLCLTTDGGVIKQVIQQGNGDFPKTTDSVSVHYEGYLEQDGTKFDSSYLRHSPFVFTLGEGKVISGWEIAVKSMQVGEIANITCTSQYAYGTHGRPPIIPSNATLRFKVHLISIQESTETPAYRIKMATELKVKGNDHYKKGQIDEALTIYKQANDYIINMDDKVAKEDHEKVQTISSSIFGNMAACYLKLHDWNSTIHSCEKVLELDAVNIKAYYRLGQAYSEMNDIEEAVRWVKLGLKNIPNDESLRILYAQLEKKYLLWKNRNKEKYKNMFIS
ncbi:uncharacterized protein BX664DRAFT_359292 [Halteromyces radiatus]|uniref:uncharacterized protein n=1 Tax=Halteromyces radiatus TaxID=101107 RepID=UPI0022203CA8|nr:uncharacterized protein BX664DRAFT_359292 [Halteromyces radiatus]KAI8089776.1 hypothetical protein BX664DRAFT_359292 [Halteromyces radiatus]